MTERTIEREGLLTVYSAAGEASLEFTAKSSFLNVGGQRFVLLMLKDISDHKRKETTERIVFSDVLSTLTTVSELMSNREQSYGLSLIAGLQGKATLAVAELCRFRDLSLAEAGRLTPEPTEFDVSEFMNETADFSSVHCPDKQIRCNLAVPENLTIRTDRVLLGHSLTNLIDNALEATKPNGEIWISASDTGRHLTISVQNPEPMSRAIQIQIFRRSFSTKGEPGRGLGTYATRLFVEKYLGGNVSFTSSAELGTTFLIEVPFEFG
jgi:signal transduction histidine kinase